MPTEQTISIGYGKANFDTSSSSLSAFVIEAPFTRQYPSQVIHKKSHTQVFPSTADEKIGGKMLMDTFEAADGIVFCLQNSHRSHGQSIKDGAVFIRLRADGPCYTVSAMLPINRQSILGDSFLAFQGSGDLLSLNDLHDVCIVPTKSWVSGFLEAEEIEQTFIINELRAERAPKPRNMMYTTLSGAVKSTAVAAPQRRLKIR